MLLENLARTGHPEAVAEAPAPGARAQPGDRGRMRAGKGGSHEPCRLLLPACSDPRSGLPQGGAPPDRERQPRHRCTFPGEAKLFRRDEATPFGLVGWFDLAYVPPGAWTRASTWRWGTPPRHRGGQHPWGDRLHLRANGWRSGWDPSSGRICQPPGAGFSYTARGPNGRAVEGVLVIRRGRPPPRPGNRPQGGRPPPANLHRKLLGEVKGLNPAQRGLHAPHHFGSGGITRREGGSPEGRRHSDERNAGCACGFQVVGAIAEVEVGAGATLQGPPQGPER